MRGSFAWRLWSVMCGLVAALGWTAPAAAHPAGVQPAVDVRTTVTGVVPGGSGLQARFVHDSSMLWVRNHSAVEVRVLGYQGEPWWRIGPDGVWENTIAPSRFVDSPADAVAAHADATAEPQWRRVSAEPVARWQDHRAVWHGPLPDVVTTDPGTDHQLREWAVPVVADGRTMNIVGTLDYVAPPRPDVWVLLMLAGVAAVAVGGARMSRLIVAGALAVAGLLALGYAATVAAFAAGPGFDAFAGQLTGHLLALVTGAGALAAAVVVARRRRVADLAAALGGFFVAVVVGWENAPVFGHAVAPVPVDGFWARLVVAVVVIGGAGSAVAGLLWIRRALRAVHSSTVSISRSR